MTKVLFLKEKDGDGVFAYFPELVHNNDLKTCYAHIGQHSACHPDYAKECTEAPINQFLDLLQELISIGYNDLLVMNEQTILCRRSPTVREIKFGEGGIHYRNFPLSIIGLKKGKAEWKKWFISSDDGLRYYTT